MDRSRAITWSDTRRQMMNVTAERLDMTTGQLVRLAFTSLLLTMAQHDYDLAVELCEIAGIDVEELEDIDALNLDADGFGK